MSATFDPSPILDRFAGNKDRDTADILGVGVHTVRSWRTGRRRIKATAADRLAVGLGLHPAELWPEWWGTDR